LTFEIGERDQAKEEDSRGERERRTQRAERERNRKGNGIVIIRTLQVQ